MNEIKNCPFCGEFNCRVIQLQPENWVVVCDTCKAIGPKQGKEKTAKACWSIRAGDRPVTMHDVIYLVPTLN